MMIVVVAARRYFGNFKGLETEVLEIQPQELNFTFELKKQSLCSVHLVNQTNDYVAFKVNTTSPKKYCVRPNTGVILPRSTCDLTVIMQAHDTAPQDMRLKDKFLIQSTIAPYGSGNEDIVPGLFSKENGKYIEEHKMRVVLVSPPHSPVLQPINGAFKHDPINEAPVVKETLISKDQAPLIEVENLPLPHMEIEDLKLQISNLESKLCKEIEDLKLQISNLQLKQDEANKTIETKREEESFAIQERDELHQLFIY